MTFVLLYSSQLQPPVTEIETQRENIYVLMQNNQFEVKMWCYTLMFGKNISTMHPSLCVYIYMNLTYTSRDPGQLNWSFYYKTLSFYYWGPSGQPQEDMR